MSQQEMSFEGNGENRQEYYQPVFEQSAQKVSPRPLSKTTALKIRLWLAYLSLALAMVASFLLGGQNWDIGVENIAPHWVVLLAVYLVIITVNVAVNIFIASRYRR